MKSLDEITRKIDELKALKSRLAAREKSESAKARRAADTTVKILAGAVLAKRWPDKMYDVPAALDARDRKRFVDAMHTLGEWDADTCAAISPAAEQIARPATANQ